MSQDGDGMNGGMDGARIDALAARLDDAAVRATAVAQSGADDAFTLAGAYAVQKALIDRRLGRGARRVGMKMGFTSRAKMQQMGLSDLIWGRLTSDMLVEDGGVDAIHHVHPRVEPEVCFLLKRELSGRLTPPEAMAAVEAVAPALEIIDSRYENFRFSLPDVVADNASSSGLVVGAWQRPDIDLSNLGLVLSFDGRPMEIGTTAAILGHPLRSLVAAARLVVEAGETLPAGSLVMAGGATAAVALVPGVSVLLEVQRLGRVQFGMPS